MSDINAQLREYGNQLDEMATSLADLSPDTCPDSATAEQEMKALSRVSPRLVAFAGAFAVVLVGVSVSAWLLRGDDAGGTDPASTETGLRFSEIKEPPAMPSVDELWTGDGGRLFVSGSSGTWTTADGEVWTKAQIPTVTPGMRVASFGGGLVSVTESGQFGISMDGLQWRYPALPEDVSASHPAMTLRYFVEDVAFGAEGIVVQGFATSSVEPAAVEAAYPEIGRVIDVSPIAPCGPAGGPIPCEVATDDALWVQTVEEQEWQAVSLSGMGLVTEDVWRAYRVIWHSADGESFETIEQRVLSEHGYGPDPRGLVATDAGFVMIDETVWTSHDGREWVNHGPPPHSVTDLFRVGSRVFGTNLHQVVEYLPDGSWTVAADASSLRALGFNEVVIEAVGESGYVAAIYEEDVLSPELAGEEPLSIARIVGVSADGTSWTTTSLEDALGASGAVEVGVIGDRVVIVLGPGKPEDFVPIVDPEWWIGTIDH